MTIDKFGRSLKSRDKDVKGPKGEGFNLTPDGDYDMQNKRLCNLKEPIDTNDAISKNYMRSNTLYLNEKGYFDAKNCKIRNVRPPTNTFDAATKGYVDFRNIPFNNEYYMMGNKILRDVHDGIEDSDAVNLRMLKTETASALRLVDNNYFDCQAKQLKNIADPTELQDVANVNYIVRLLSKVLYDIYNTIDPIQIDKNDWINTHVIEKYFINKSTRRFRDD